MIHLSRKNFLNNIKSLVSLIPGQKCGLVVKSNAYGHGAQLIAQCAQESGCIDYLLTFSASEGLALRKAGISLPILAMGYCDIPCDICCDNDIEIALPDRAMLENIEHNLRALGKKIRVHIKVDTGLGRLGCSVDSELQELIGLVERSRCSELVGIFSHISDSDLSRSAYTYQQIEAFVRACQFVKRNKSVCAHLFSSGSLIFAQKLQEIFKKNMISYPCMVRIGSSAYGFYKSQKHKELLSVHGVSLQPVATWMSQSVQVKTIERGECIGYGCQFRASRPMRIALVPVGYADGYPRTSSEQRFVFVCGKKAPVVGSVCMNMIACDVTDITNFAVHENITILGGGGECSCTQWAPYSQMLPWELTTRFSQHIPRRWCI